MNTVGVPRTSVAAGSRLRHWCEPPGGAVRPSGSECSIVIGTGTTSACRARFRICNSPFFDIEAARAALVTGGFDVGKPSTTWGCEPPRRDPGTGNWPNPERANYGSSASFSDPDGNGCLLQAVKTRGPGR
jgi:hypothetical protein